jgi:hypothetical protein
MLFKYFGCVALGLILVSCGSLPPARRKIMMPDETSQPIRHSMTFIIHGDGDYLYHDASGNAYRADQEALAGARKVAEQNSQAEVFIFHQRPRRHILLFFPLRDGTVYHYRNGRLLDKEPYWRTQKKSRFEPEVAIYNRLSAGEQLPSKRIFLYFGHQIPEFGGAGYDHSSPDRIFTVAGLAEGLNQMKPISAVFDLIVLSTCFNGTPSTVSALGPFARYIIASPGNLHRSYYDLHSLEKLEAGLADGDMSVFAKNFAQQAFERLAKDIQTEISISVYEVERTRKYLNSVSSGYEQSLTEVMAKKTGSLEYCDCSEDSAYARPGMSEGVDVFYRPPRFGRLKNKQSHSGWGCWSPPKQSP